MASTSCSRATNRKHSAAGRGGDLSRRSPPRAYQLRAAIYRSTVLALYATPSARCVKRSASPRPHLRTARSPSAPLARRQSGWQVRACCLVPARTWTISWRRWRRSALQSSCRSFQRGVWGGGPSPEKTIPCIVLMIAPPGQYTHKVAGGIPFFLAYHNESSIPEHGTGVSDPDRL